MTEALEPAGWTACGTRCQCMCHRNPDVRHFMACCSSEKRDTPMTKSILSEQREADEELCGDLGWLRYGHCDPEDIDDICRRAIVRIRALSEALQEACHERDGLLAKVERDAS